MYFSLVGVDVEIRVSTIAHHNLEQLLTQIMANDLR